MTPPIVVIDDDAMVRISIQRILEAEGYEVALAHNGREGLSLTQRLAPRLVITDIIMPEKEGIETIRDIRALDPAVRIVAISGDGIGPNVDFLRIARKLGADATLAKPFRREELLACVEGRRVPPKDSMK